jgi:transcription initiation factor IIE alpha subunit
MKDKFYYELNTLTPEEKVIVKVIEHNGFLTADNLAEITHSKLEEILRLLEKLSRKPVLTKF